MLPAIRLVLSVLILLLLLLGPWFYWRYERSRVRNFRVVRSGVLYRSGQMTLNGLQQILRDYNIRTVITLRAPHQPGAPSPNEAEEALCRQLGVKYVHLPPKAWANHDGEVDANARRFCALVSDPRHQPVLVHCFAGKHRTGAYCAIYRMECEGWSNEAAIAEMAACGYETIGEDEDVRQYLERYRPTGQYALSGRRW